MAEPAARDGIPFRIQLSNIWTRSSGIHKIWAELFPVIRWGGCSKFCVNTKWACRTERFLIGGALTRCRPVSYHNAGGGGYQGWRSRLYPLDVGLQRCYPNIRSENNTGHLCVDYAPVLPSAGLFFGDIHHGQVQHFQEVVVRGEHGFRLGHLTELAVDALYGIGRIDQPPHLLRILELGTQVGPVLPPGLRYLAVFLSQRSEKESSGHPERTTRQQRRRLLSSRP